MTKIAQLSLGIKAQFGRVLNGRIEAGAQLASVGGVSQVDFNTWSVASQSAPGAAYTVKFEMAWSCTCPDHLGNGYHPAPVIEFFGGTQRTCKHITAAALAWSAGGHNDKA